LQRVFDAGIIVTGAWTIVSSRAITGSSIKWLRFANGVALCGLAVLALVVREVLIERQLRHVAAPARGARDGRREQWVHERAWAGSSRSPVGA
jgi:hypothetical protein